MKLKEVLLKGISFNELLKQFAVDQSDFTIQDEEMILSNQEKSCKEIFKERVLIQARNNAGTLLNFFGTLHYNLLDQLAVFEPDYVEQNSVAAA
ncbi:hypothetical protein GS399_14395 [Pedobacter sp. HMF7647]|uniref:Uncharacterized protein n=1 Tax=Hufsiella arboris TaxID=2695275 RepID=A0A7K1YC50_9SPHI|nr:hypothetical protein [Hufsiella arboris]MXV52164.1 hypothetical protein [Hufsiella arboris]